MNVSGTEFRRRRTEMTNEWTSGNPLGTSFDAVEYGRGQFSALAYVSATSAQDVHVLRLRRAFERAGMTRFFRYSLRVLSLMREVQELRGGYWFPTPLRVVPIAGQAIIVGSTSTRELQRHFSGVTRVGYARILPQLDATALPTQDLDDWLGLDIQDTVAWSELQITNASENLGPTISSSSIQFFSIRSAQTRFGTTTTPVWMDNPRSSLVGRQGVILCRECVASGRFRYFLGRMRGDRLIAECSAPKDVFRFQFGLAALADKPCTVVVSSCEDRPGITLPASIPLPRPERQLVLALCTPYWDLSRKKYRVGREAFTQLIVPRLQRLGCDVRWTGA